MAVNPRSSHGSATCYLQSRINYERSDPVPYAERNFKLDRMRALLQRLGNPQRGLPAIHVAGSKGKGSTSHLVAAGLTASGHRTGLYTSPHLFHVRERIRIDEMQVTAADLDRLASEIRPAVEALDSQDDRPTYFEITTAMALLHFRQQQVDACVLEVGLGGRLDSTNVCEPAVTLITSISFDHTHLLGDTLTAIAHEKAGIIKHGVPLVSGVTEPEPAAVINRLARRRGAPCYRQRRDYTVRVRPDGHQLQVEYREPARDFRQSLSLGLLGRHQGYNAGVALCGLRRLRDRGWRIDELAVQAAWRHVRCPARIELLDDKPPVVLDTAHNVASLRALLQALDDHFRDLRRVVVFGTSRDKNAAAMLAELLPRVDALVLTRYHNNPRGIPSAQLRDLLEPNGVRIECRDDPRAACALGRELAQGDKLLAVTGSFYLAAECRPWLVDSPSVISA